MKDKQIEEMAKIIDDRLLEARNWLGSMNKGEGYWIAQELVKHYQPKLSEDSVVLSKEEYDDLQVGKDFDYGYHEGVKNTEAYYENFELTEARKETASEIFEEMLLFLQGETFHKGYELKKVERKVREIAKKFGVEVEDESSFN